jgi:2-polyprenyl-3-methyl-5-hydroxy-6-metoxy-1,4-benzoquinol methylase
VRRFCHSVATTETHQAEMMTDTFGEKFWNSHWQAAGRAGGGSVPPSPYLESELSGITPGTALDAGCGEGAEAIWLAAHGSHVTAADISRTALARAAERADAEGAEVEWIEADLASWVPGRRFSLVSTFYAHPTTPQHEFYTRIAGWVAPGGSLLIVGHRSGSAHGPQPAPQTMVTAASVSALLDAATWDVRAAHEPQRTLHDRDGHAIRLRDVVVHAVRRS